MIEADIFAPVSFIVAITTFLTLLSRMRIILSMAINAGDSRIRLNHRDGMTSLAL